MEINSKMTIAEIIKQNPESAKVLQKFVCIALVVLLQPEKIWKTRLKLME